MEHKMRAWSYGSLFSVGLWGWSRLCIFAIVGARALKDVEQCVGYTTTL